MSAVATVEAVKSEVKEREVEFIPFGEKSPIKLSIGMIRRYIAKPTKSGKLPSDEDLMQFLMLCKTRELNPWVGDAYLIGYDSQGSATFTLVAAIQSLYKRAEANAQYDGMESGVIVEVGDQIKQREGDLVFRNEKLIGGWARCYRKDRSRPTTEALDVTVYDKGVSQWNKDKAGMIVKCAEASVLRRSFPTQLGGLYLSEEMSQVHQIDAVAVTREEPRSRTERLAGRLQESTKAIEHVASAPAVPEPMNPEAMDVAGPKKVAVAAASPTKEAKSVIAAFRKRLAHTTKPNDLAGLSDEIAANEVLSKEQKEEFYRDINEALEIIESERVK